VLDGNTLPWSAAWSGLAPLVHMTAVNVSCLAFGLWHVLAARHVTSFNPVFADLPGGQLGRVYGVVVAVSGTAVAGLVLCWLRLRSRSLLAPALVHATVNGLGYGFAFLAWRAP
jgi:CAAX protease family protein